MTTIQGLMLIDVDVAALNNAGNADASTLENAVATKKITKNRKTYAYVSGQAWRYWWRESLVKNFSWQMSPVTRDKKIAYTDADPAIYPDDDLFGYMRAAKKEVVDPETGKKKKENITLTRASPLKNSALIATAGTGIAQNFSSMTRSDGDPIPYGKDEYCAVMKGQFSIDIDQVGTFSSQNKSGFMNINETMSKIALENGATEVEDPLAKDAKGNPLKLIRIPDTVRKQRISDAVKALAYLSGGAKQATNMADVTPKLIILTKFKSGNHPFSSIIQENTGPGTQTTFSIKAFRETLSDYKDQFDGKIYIGIRSGFLNEIKVETELEKLVSENENIVCGSIMQAINGFIETVTF